MSDFPPAPDFRVPPDPPTVARYRAALNLDEVYEFALTPLDVTGIPVWTVATWLDGEFTSGIGYGTTDDRARIGAWGELAEGVFVHRLREMATQRGSYRDLAEAGARAVDPLRLRLPVGTDYTEDTERLWVEATRFVPGTSADEESAWMLLDEAAAHTYNLPPDYTPLYTPITNGLGAGDTPARALAHGLLELVQRDASSTGYRAFDRGLVLDLGGVPDPETRRWIEQIEDAGITLMAKLAGTPLGIPVIYVVGRERDLGAMPHPLVLTGCGEGAHPDRERALQKAVLEYGASRVRKRFAHGPVADLEGRVPDAYLRRVREMGVEGEEGRATDAVAEWAGLDGREQLRRLENRWFREAERLAFADLPTDRSLETPEALAADVARRCADAGLEAYSVALSPPDADVSVVKTIVPGLEVETVTYGRIGPRNVRRLLGRIEAGDAVVHPDLVGIGRPPAEAQPVPLAPEGEAALGGSAWVHLDLMEEAAGPIYAMYREPAEHVVGLRAEGAGAEAA
ncbi:MAG: YcaO-like family protein [Bacteroidota bacterium]